MPTSRCLVSVGVSLLSQVVRPASVRAWSRPPCQQLPVRIQTALYLLLRCVVCRILERKKFRDYLKKCSVVNSELFPSFFRHSPEEFSHFLSIRRQLESSRDLRVTRNLNMWSK